LLGALAEILIVVGVEDVDYEVEMEVEFELLSDKITA